MRITHTVKKYISLFLTSIIICLTLFSPNHAVHASGIQIYNYNTNTKTNYTGTQVIFQCNGKEAKMDMPGIIIDNIALASYSELFADIMGITCAYNSESGVITFSEGSNHITMTLGSKTAVVNGTNVTMSVAPVKIKFVDYDMEKIYVPTRFVSENLGYSYVWVKTSSTAKITKTLSLSLNNTNFEYSGTFYGIQYNQTAIDLGQLPLFSYHGVVMARAKKIFEEAGCEFSQNNTGITLKKGDITLNMSFNEKNAYVNGKKFVMEEAAYLAANNAVAISYAIVPLEFTATMLGFDLIYDDSEKEYSLLTTERTGNASLIDALKQYQNAGENNNEGSGSSTLPQNQYFEWKSDASFETILEQTINPVHIISTENVVDVPINLYIYRNQKTEENGSEIFQFVASDKICYVESEITSSGTLKVTVHNALSSNSGELNIGLPLVSSYNIVTNETDKTVTIEFNLSKSTLNYSISLAEDERILQITVLPNYLTKVAGYSNANSDAVILYGIDKEDIELVDDGGMLIINLPTTTNCIGNQFFYNTDNPYLTYCLLNSISDGSRITVVLNPDTKYYMYSDSTEYTSIHFTNNTITEVDNGIITPSSITAGESLPDDQLLIPLPDGITLNDISDQDNYLNTNFILSIRGNHTSFFKQNPIHNPYSVIENSSVYYNSSTNTTNISFDTKLICAYQYDISQGYLIVNVARPSEIYSKIVVLDAGHGGIDPGAIKNGIYEKTLNYTVLNQYAKEYFANSDIKVYYTRLSDVKIDLYERADFASEVGADLFISLHMNANNSSSVSGTQVFYSSLNNTKNAAGLTSNLLGKAMVTNLCNVLGTKNRGVSSSEFVVVKYNTVPAILIELGFMTNANELKLLTDASFQKKAAKTIYETVVQIFKDYPTKR